MKQDCWWGRFRDLPVRIKKGKRERQRRRGPEEEREREKEEKSWGEERLREIER